MNKKRIKVKKSDFKHIANFFRFSRSPIKSIAAVLILGVTLGVAYEEFVGIGTWHNFHPNTDKVNVCFTPPSGCGGLIAQEIVKAKDSIFVQAYGLTAHSIIYQLKVAKTRGVKVHVLLDGGNLSDNQSIYNELKQAGIKVFFDKLPGIAHNKVMIIDKKKVITGSFNFTNAADNKNAENVLLIKDREIAKEYLNNYQSRYQRILNNLKLEKKNYIK